MELVNKNKIISFIIIIIVLWILWTLWNTTENFTITDGEPRHWGKQWYYSDQTRPVLPSIANYDSQNYKLPQSSIALLTPAANEHKTDKDLPKPHNVHSAETSKFGGNENIHQVGAPIDNLFEAEITGMNNVMPNETMNKTLIYGAGSEIPENVSTDQESVLHELPKQESETEKSLNQNLMPGSEQKKEMEQKMEQEQPLKSIVVRVKRVNYNMSILLLLIVILIGFVYAVKDY
jgi:hypothetical protein